MSLLRKIKIGLTLAESYLLMRALTAFIASNKASLENRDHETRDYRRMEEDNRLMSSILRKIKGRATA